MFSDLRSFLALIHPQRWKYLFGLFALMLVNLSDVLSPVFMAVAIDLTEAQLTGNSARTTPILAMLGLETTDFSLAMTLALYLAFQVAANVFRYPMLMYVAVPSHEVGQNVRRRLVDHLLKLGRPFFDKARSGDLMTLATNDVNAVRMAVGPGVLVGADTLFIVTFVLIVLFALSWKLTLIAMIPLPIIAIVTNKLSHAEHVRFREVQNDLGKLTERVRESYAGIRIIKGYAREDHDRARMLDFSTRHLRKNLDLARVHSIFDPTLDLMLGVSTTLVLIFGGLQVVHSEITLGTFVAFLFLVRYLAGPMIGFGWSVSLFQRGRASLARLLELWGTPILIRDDEASEVIPAAAGAISVNNLTFGYGADDTHALADVSFEVPAGASVGIIGPVGAGKSTLVNLMVRLYDPPRGTVFLDGRDVRSLRLTDLRRDIVLAPQDTFLFSDTVARNLALTTQAGSSEVEQYAQLAQLHDEIEGLGNGYDTLLGERGVNLSGGQRQRLAIARAIAADPKVLVLDDCLSAVDASTEEAILDGLDEVFTDRTGVIVSHRVCAVRRCDEILVIDEGRVVERGSHAQLLGADGWYAGIAREQARES
jgi:ATP-binding cassette, subfamily B, multidrug efflux pump